MTERSPEQQLRSLRERILAAQPRRIAVLTGAGISAESGVPTFRGAGGLWENHRPEQLATPEAFARDPELVWRWYEWRRDLVRRAEPNAAHRALGELQSRAPTGCIVSIVTQNVDGLHRRAGTGDLIELHGNIFRVRCTRDDSVREVPEALLTLPPLCACGALERPDVVWFGESLEPHVIERATGVCEAADLFLLVGTSAVVYPAAGLVNLARGAIRIEVNPDITPATDLCDIAVHSSAVETVPSICAAIEESWS